MPRPPVLRIDFDRRDSIVYDDDATPFLRTLGPLGHGQTVLFHGWHTGSAAAATTTKGALKSPLRRGRASDPFTYVFGRGAHFRCRPLIRGSCTRVD
jgi:hypothetical protein